ncbi:F-box protein At3g07870-like [Impatiens glandulifera]|uniref:F-box protein At3g07870-like n=1 Tax=Impatiens glandulifera TaxID=253017 RepID=UPI001FB0879D|nr:F-box protein At3g07870-like [Impatiens glandulifera]
MDEEDMELGDLPLPTASSFLRAYTQEILDEWRKKKKKKKRSDQALVKVNIGENPFIPEDLFLNILLSLPIKYILRWRQLSRKWNFQLRSPEFISLHYNHLSQKRFESLKSSSSSSSFILLRAVYDPNNMPLNRRIVLTYLTLKKTGTNIIPTIDREEKVNTVLSLMFTPDDVGLPYPSEIQRVQLFCLFDGLICLGYGLFVMIYNPATRELHLLPTAPSLNNHSFDFQYLTPCILGVWYKSAVKQYKVFSMIYWSDCCKINVYDSTLNDWRRISKTIFGKPHPDVFLLFNGVVHFYMENHLDDRSVIVTLDAISETFGHLELPCFGEFCNISSLLPFRGKLAFLEPNIELNDASLYCDLWVMTEYGVNQSWTKQYSVTIDLLDSLNVFYHYTYRPLTFINFMDEKDDELLMRTHNGKIVCCNLVTGKITDLELSCIYFRTTNIVPYNVESLFTLK